MRGWLWLYLRDRMGYILLVYAQLFLVLALLHLNQSFTLPHDALPLPWGYAFLLTTILLLLFLGIQFARLYPYYQWLDRGRKVKDDLDSFAVGNKIGNREGEQVYQVCQNLYHLAIVKQQQLQQMQRQQEEFINLWVHQMKASVATLLLLAQKKDQVESSLRLEIEEEVDRLDHGLDMVLSMARLQDFSTDIQLERVNLVEAVREMIHAYKKRWIRYGVFPKVTDETESGWVFTDRKWNRFVIEQIVQNAIKYTSQSGKRGRIEFRIMQQGERVVLQIQDQGPGIPAQDLPRVFQPFFTGENGRNFAQATGMGLYLVKKVLDQLQHSIQIESTVGEGTTVRISYPQG